MKARIIARKTASTVIAAAMAIGCAGTLTAWADTACADADNTFTFSDTAVTAEESSGGYTIDGTSLTISASGTYVITGSGSEGSVTVKKGTTGVTLILSDLTLASSETAPLTVGKNAEVTIDIENNNTLSDKEDPANETSADEAVADAFEGAAVKVKSGAAVTFTGSGKLTVDGSECKNGIKGASEAALTVGESASDSFELDITAANDALASDGNVTVNGGSLTISAGDDGIHSDYTLTINGGDIDILKSEEGLEGATVNMAGGTGNIVSSDDGVNASNSDLTDYTYELNISGGSWIINAEGDGLDSNGDLNVSGGYTVVYGSTTGGNGALDIGDGNYSFNYTGGTLIAFDIGDMVVTPTSGKYVVFGQSGMGGQMPGDGTQPAAPADGTEPPAAPADGTQPADGTTPPELPDGTQPAAPSDGGQQSGVRFSVTAGQTVVIKDSSGSEIFSGTAAKNASHIIFCSDKLTSDGSYTLYVDGTAAVTSTVSDGAQQGTQTQPADDSSPQGDEPQQDDGSSESETKPDAPAQTSVTSFSCTQTAIRINWTAVDGASGYRVYRYNSKLKKYERIAVVDASVLTYRDSGLTAGTKYKYKVIACASNSAGTTLGKASTPYTAATKALRPSIKKTKSSSNAVRLYWSKVKCTGYKIQQYDSSTGKWKTVKIVSSKTTNAAVSGLSSGTSYKFRIVPFTRTSGKTVTGKVSKAVKASTK